MSEAKKETQRVAVDDVKRVAELAYLELTAEEEVRMQRDLNAILDYVAQLNELDTSSVEPMAQVSRSSRGRFIGTASRHSAPCRCRAKP